MESTHPWSVAVKENSSPSINVFIRSSHECHMSRDSSFFSPGLVYKV